MTQAITLLLALAGALTTVTSAQAQDAAAGRAKATACIGCHGISGYQASFPEIHKVPMISGQNAKFIAASLEAYKKGERKHPTMRAVAGSLSEQDMADLGAFYEGHGLAAAKPVSETASVAPPPAVAALLAKGACASCHGANFNKPIDGAYPKIAGQHADYLNVALRSYAIEGNPQVGRSNAIMGGQVKQYSRAELQAMAKYLASLPGDVRTVPQSKFR